MKADFYRQRRAEVLQSLERESDEWFSTMLLVCGPPPRYSHHFSEIIEVNSRDGWLKRAHKFLSETWGWNSKSDRHMAVIIFVTRCSDLKRELTEQENRNET